MCCIVLMYLCLFDVAAFIYSARKLLTNSKDFGIIESTDDNLKGEDSMAKYEYEVCELKEVDVPPCPLCGSDDLHFWSHNREDDRSAGAGVKCMKCGHEVTADGYELHLDWALDCQLAAIEKWKEQVAKYGRH